MANTNKRSSTLPRVAVAVVVCDEKALLIQRAKDLGGDWTFPGGKVEPGENAVEAAVRELNEEVLVQCRPVKTIGWRKHPETGLGISYVLFDAPDMKASVKEVDKFSGLAWCTVEDLESRTQNRVFPKVKAAISRMQAEGK